MQSSNQVLLQIQSLLNSVQPNDVPVVPSAHTIQTSQTETSQTEISQTDADVTQSAVSVPTVTQTELSKEEKFLKIMQTFWRLTNGESLIEKMFSEQITLDTIFELWDSEICDMKCLDFFCKNYNKLTTDEFIKRINFRIICLISQSEKLNLEENEIFSLINKWIKLTNPNDSFKKELLSNIRLPLIKPNFLASDVKESGLFSETELLEAFYHQTLPTKRTELRFQEREYFDSEIYLGSSSGEYANYRRVPKQDIIAKGFRKSLIASLKKNGDKLEFIGKKPPGPPGPPGHPGHCRIVTEEDSCILIGCYVIYAESTANIETDRFFSLSSGDIKRIYDEESYNFRVGSTNDGEPAYGFFVKKF